MTSPAEREVEAAMAAERRKVLDAMNELATIAEITKPLDARRDLLREQVRQYLDIDGLDSLTDGETGVVARLQDRNASPTYDLATLAKGPGAEAIIDAAKAGMLRVDHVMLERFRKAAGAIWADDIASVQMPGPVSSALYIEKGERK